MDAYLGEIRTFGFGQIPRNWLACSGQIISIAQNQALFSLLGTTYGGNGVTTFNLPNLQGSVMLGYGNSYAWGQVGGTESVTLNTTQLPPHNHNVRVVDALAVQVLNNGDDYLSRIGVFVTNPQSTNYSVNGYATTVGTPAVLAPATVTPAGGNLPHENRSSFLTVSICICTNGYFPSRA